MKNARSHGFTIVELLIVIVVIAILAAVSTFAYNGVQQRAVNSQVAQAVQATEKAVRAHYSVNNTPLQAMKEDWFHRSIAKMAGVCIGNSWPSDEEMRRQLDTNNTAWTGSALKSFYCGWYGHTSMTVDEATQLMDDAVANSQARDMFVAMPSFNPITLRTPDRNNNMQNLTIRGIRYAYNNSPTNPTSYIYYPLYGKKCLDGDQSVNLFDTIWASDGGSVWNGTFNTGGDYTANDTVNCVRFIRYQ